MNLIPMKAPCAVCGEPVEVEMGPPAIIRMTRQTLVVFDHPNQVLCKTCGKPLIPVVAQVGQILVGTLVVPPKDQSLVIPAGGGLVS